MSPQLEDSSLQERSERERSSTGVELTTVRTQGWCDHCEEQHELDGHGAFVFAELLKQHLSVHRCIDFELPASERDARLRLEALEAPSGGQMFGVLVAQDRQGEQMILKAFSGQFESVWQVHGWVSPVVDLDERGQLVPDQFEIEARIKDLSERMSNADSSRDQLRTERRRLSKRLMADIHAAYLLRNRAGSTRSLLTAFTGRKGVPSGTGDCCAPKLLQAAYRRDLQPTALLEFWWGGPKVIGRQHGAYYGACADKCEPILGFMLCGAQP